MTVWIMSSPSAISTLEKKRPPVSCSPGERWLRPENLLEFAIRTSQAVPARVTDRTDYNSNRTGCKACWDSAWADSSARHIHPFVSFIVLWTMKDQGGSA